MGYYSDYTIEANGDFIFTDEMLEKYFRNGMPSVNHANNCIEGNTKWYESVIDMKVFSANFPETLFTMGVGGEEAGDVWRGYFKAGKAQVEQAQIIIADFDEAKLK